MSKELYDKVISAYRTGDENAFNAAARNWVEGAENAPFNDPEASDLFFSAKRHCKLWRSNAISGRVSKLRMIECIRKIAEKNLPNPYAKSKEKSKELVSEESPRRFLGVVPSEKQPEKKRIFGKRKS